MWIKSALVGLAAAIVTTVLVVAIVLARAVWWTDVGEGTGSIGVVYVAIGSALLLPVVLAFVGGFSWSLRRERRKRLG